MTERALYPTAVTILAWGVLHGDPEHRDECASELARRILGEELAQPGDDGHHQLHEPPREVRGQVAGYLRRERYKTQSRHGTDSRAR